jgi:uncharacterized protein (DUF1501 family)
MNRRSFLQAMGCGAAIALSPELSFALSAGSARYDRLLVLIELKGGNDGLNMAVPFADPAYYALRPRIAVPRDQVLQLDARTGFNPVMAELMPLWKTGELAVVQGVGYPDPNLSHFRSIEICDTASGSAEYLQQGWLARAFQAAPPPRACAADGIVVGGSELGPLAGGGVRAIALSNPEQFARQARLATGGGRAGNPTLEHILKVEQDVVRASAGLEVEYAFQTQFPPTSFGAHLRTACRAIASKGGVAAAKVSLNGFDTHSNQPNTQNRLLEELAAGLAAFKSALQEIDRWNTTLVVTYSEFGRRPRENDSKGTDHGTAATHFALGGAVRGGLFGEPPALRRLDGNGNLPFALDFRSLYATVLDRWWGADSTRVLGGRFRPIELLRA